MSAILYRVLSSTALGALQNTDIKVDGQNKQTKRYNDKYSLNVIHVET